MKEASNICNMLQTQPYGPSSPRCLAFLSFDEDSDITTDDTLKRIVLHKMIEYVYYPYFNIALFFIFLNVGVAKV